ncbi:MAG: carbohydrate kinase family protein [Gaiellaceae bacterium]|jgi:sugar/nucleoside kinase (ribokinase family)
MDVVVPALTSTEAVVAGHISLDLFPGLQGPVTLEPGRLVEVGPVVISTGGAVANTGVALHRLGVRVRLVGKVGADLFGRAILDSLADRDGDLAADMIVSPVDATSYTIVFNPPGVDRSFLHCPGANQTFSADDVRYELLAGVRVFHFGYPPLMREMYAAGGAQLRRLFERVHSAGPATSLDLSEPDPESEAGRVAWEQVLSRVLPFVDVFAPSIDELLFMLDRPAHAQLQAEADLSAVVDRTRLAELGDVLLGMGAAVVAIKLGDQGLYLRTAQETARISAFCDRIGLAAEAWRGREVLAPCFAARRVAGTTGSGDCTIAGLLAALLRGEDPADAATSATAVGACSIEALDPTSAIPPWPRVAARLASGWPRLRVDIELGRNVTVERDPAGTLTILS